MITIPPRPRASETGDAGSSVPAAVIELERRFGGHGEITRVVCRVMHGEDQGRTIARDVLGSARVGDVLQL